MTGGDRSPDTSRYKLAATLLAKETTLDALHELLLERPWPAITMTDVASAAGISRQTIYKEFRSRRGLAEGYALRLAATFVSYIESALHEHRGDPIPALQQGYSTFLDAIDTDPLVQSLHKGSPPEDLLRLITIDSGIIVESAAEQLAQKFQFWWVHASPQDARTVAQTIVRLALSYVSNPPEDAATAAAETARLCAPFIEPLRTSTSMQNTQR